ncbi:hypothetical protein ACFV9P_22585, partial [Streptomyces sp. NPDC059892]|uniref:hypothetical protein n=1 Tax=Streptomyces sp. NPDC059892 TaxID=3346989 RepID=UPI0036485962
GRIEARTRGRILTYLGLPDRYDRQLTDGWWEMGDMGYRDRLGAGPYRAGGAVRSAGRGGTAHAPTHTLVIALM